MLSDLCERAKAESTYSTDWRWWRYYVDFHAGGTEAEFRMLAEPFGRNMSLAYYGIGMQALLKRDRARALEYFMKAEAMGVVTTFPYHNSKLFIKRIDSGWLDDEF